MAGLQGVGKTTACGKLSLFLKKQNKTALLVATDVYRPAAIDQLKKLGEQIEVPVFDMGVDAQCAFNFALDRSSRSRYGASEAATSSETEVIPLRSRKSLRGFASNRRPVFQ